MCAPHAIVVRASAVPGLLCCPSLRRFLFLTFGVWIESRFSSEQSIDRLWLAGWRAKEGGEESINLNGTYECV